MSDKRPVVLCFSGHDPSGGAGIQADIETISSHRCHVCSVITALTEQNTGNIVKLIEQKPENIFAQAKTILDDIPVSAFKIGLIGHEQTARVIHTVLTEHPDIPVILDPVLAAGGGALLSNEQLITAITDLLLPCATILTPNSMEARTLAGGIEDLEQCAINLLTKGCDYVLITGAHENTPSVTNQLFHNNRLIKSYNWERLPHNYHGSGCTLASSIAAMTARRMEPLSAIQRAQQYTWETLATGFRPGRGQHLPNRLVRMQKTYEIS